MTKDKDAILLQPQTQIKRMTPDQIDERKRKEWEQIQQLLTAEEELREFLKDNIHLANGRTLVCIAKTIEALRNQIKCKIDKGDRLYEMPEQS